MSRASRPPSAVSRLVRTAGLAGAGALALASCRQVLGIEERKLKTVAEDAGGGKVASAHCVDTKCCDEATACDADPACRAAYRCQQDCAPGDSDCITWCLGSTARPESLANLVSCASARCESQCVLSCGQLVNGATS